MWKRESGSVLPFDGNGRIPLSMSLCRVPMVPREITSASRSSVTYATAIVSLWTSNPIKSVLPSATADLLLYVNETLRSLCGSDLAAANPRLAPAVSH